MMSKSIKTKGFTLAELLIVVAIISVLVAISIPIFSGKLEGAIIATNRANLRSAAADVLSSQVFMPNGNAGSRQICEIKYDISQSKIVPEKDRNIYCDGVQPANSPKDPNKVYRWDNDGILQWVYFRIYFNDDGTIEYYYLPFYDETKQNTHDIEKIFNINYDDAIKHFNINQ